MIHRTELLDPMSVDALPRKDRCIVDGAQNAGHGPRHMNTEHYSCGAMQQVVIASALMACGRGGPGGDSDLSGGCSTLGEIFAEIESEMALEGTVE